MNNFLRHILTGKDCQTYDIARVLWGIGVLAFIGLAIYDTIVRGHFEPTNYGIGFGSTMVAGGAGIALKKDTEPHVN